MKELIEEMLVLHHKWEETHGKEGEQIDFSHCHIEGGNFEGAYLACGNFNKVNFANSEFFNAFFIQSTLDALLPVEIANGKKTREEYLASQKRRPPLKPIINNRPILQLVRPRRPKPPKK
jgi:hypothetical protein